jgi:hypothetical protein
MGFTPCLLPEGVKDVAAEMFGSPRHMLEGDTQQSREWREQQTHFGQKNLAKNSHQDLHYS